MTQTLPAWPSAPLTPHQRHVCGIFALALFFAIHNIGSVFFQLRGAGGTNPSLSLIGYFTGLFLGALGMRFLERRLAGPNAVLLRGIFLAVMLLPGVFCLISFRITGYDGNTFTNSFQPLLWSLSLPVALRLFFRSVYPGQQPLYFSVAIGVGHLCWALVMPLAHAYGNPFPPEAGMRFLHFLDITRGLMCVIFALLCWRMADKEFAAPEPAPVTAVPGGTRSALWRLLTPILLCSLLNGFVGYLFFARLVGRGLYPEFMHLGLAFVFPFLGWYYFRKGIDHLRILLGFAVLRFVLAPLILFLPSGSSATQAVYLVCAVSQQIFLFCGTLAMSRHAPSSRIPALTLSSAWLAAAAAIPGNIVAAKLLPLLPVTPFAVACFLAALCAASLFLFLRAFPLPCLPEPQPDAARLPAFANGNSKLLAFAVAFGLSARESEVFSAVARGQEMAAIGESLGISERTARFHLTGVLRKTNLPSRKRLETFFAAWKE